MNNQEPTKEQLELQVNQQNKMIQGFQQEIGSLTGDKIALSIAYQEALQKLDSFKSSEIAELNKQAEEMKKDDEK